MTKKITNDQRKWQDYVKRIEKHGPPNVVPTIRTKTGKRTSDGRRNHFQAIEETPKSDP